jgi:hypothetical protein
MMVIRSTVKPREKSQEEGSEDRQPKTAPAAATPASVTVRAGVASSPPPLLIGTVADAEMDLDGCDALAGAPIIADEQLPQAQGGVA